MPSEMSKPIENTIIEEQNWNWLFRIAGAAALLMFVIIPVQIVIFLASPPPQSVPDYFALFQHNRLLGLLDLDFLLLVDNLLSIPLYLALYIALKRKNESFVLIATFLGLLSIMLYLVSREATFSMATLSDQYVLAASETQRQILLAAGQVLLVSYNGTVFNISYVLGALALIILSLVMLRTSLFNKATAYLGLVANLIALGLYFPSVGIYISVFSVLFLWVWDLLIALRLLQFGNPNSPKRFPPS
jgi:MFS family permease